MVNITHVPHSPVLGTTIATSVNYIGTSLTAMNILPSLSVEGDIKIDGDIKKGDVSLFDSLSRIEQELKLPEVIRDNPHRRKTHKKLQELYDAYQEEEKKLQMWEALQDDYKG